MRDLLSIENLSVAFEVGGRWVPVLRRVSLQIDEGDFVGLVGESGSGKSVMAMSVLRLLPRAARVIEGRIRFKGQDLLELPETQMRTIRGGRVGIVFQEPMTSLNPVFSIGFQVAEAVRAHRPMGSGQARAEAERLLDLVGIAPAGERLDDYPHQFSGGQLQRVVLAMALAAEPELLIADEPTSALDVTVQAEILELLGELRTRLGLAVLLITHDLAVVAETCSRVSVMYAGQIVETAATRDLFDAPAHPYTRGLLASIPRLGRPEVRGQLPAIPGQAPALGDLPTGCSFHPRCGEVMEQCRVDEPPMARRGTAGKARCFLMDSSTVEIAEIGREDP